MKNRTYITIFLLVSLYISQSGFTPSLNAQPAQHTREKISLFTERSLYVVDEDLSFRASCLSGENTSELQLSKVLYVELINWRGEKTAQSKFAIQDGETSGAISIPVETVSGVYYLRAYTKWMRNFSPYHYVYVPLKIVNPASAETIPGPDSGSSENDRDSLDFESGGERFKLKCTKKEYLPSESFYYPETRGLTLSGKLVDQHTGSPIEGRQLNLSTVSSPAYFAKINTDASGTFLFTFPFLQGTYEFNLILADTVKADVNILVDADYCNRSVTLPFIPFELNQAERELALQQARKVQLAQFSDEGISRTEEKPPVLPFYGRPSRTVYKGDYIELDDIREFLFELLYGMQVRYTDGRPQVFTTGISTLMNYPVLLLMDNRQVFHVEELLDIPCSSIQRFEIIENNYVIGSNMYGGLLSIFSVKGDMAGLSSGENSIYFDFQMIDPRQEILIPGEDPQ